MPPAADPFAVACPNCACRFDLTNPAVRVQFTALGRGVATCPVCDDAIPVRTSPKPVAVAETPTPRRGGGAWASTVGRG